jgi:hypothetical protein
MALRDYFTRSSREPKPTEPPPGPPEVPEEVPGQVHLPARLLAVLAAVPPCGVALIVAWAYPLVFWVVPLQMVPYVWLLRQRDRDGFRHAAFTAGGICVFEGLMVLLIGVILAVPTVFLLTLAVASLKEPRQLRHNVAAVTGLSVTGALVLLFTASLL